MTNAKAAFDVNMQRARYFIELHKKYHQTKGAPTKPLRELPRASLVFAIGAMDAYLSDLTAEIIVRRFQAGQALAGDSSSVLAQISKELPSLPLEVALMPTAADRAARVQDAIASHFYEKVSNHGTKAVANTLQRLGVSPKDVWSKMKDAGYPKAAEEFEDWTSKRHRIVHQGESVPFQRVPAQHMLEAVATLAQHIDELVEAAN